MAAPTVSLSPVAVQFFEINGIPATGGKLFVYAAGTTTKITTYTDSTGNTAQTNPIVFNSRGEPETTGGASVGIWVVPTTSMKLVLAPSTDTDPPTNPIWTVDNIVATATTTYFDLALDFLGGTPPTSNENMRIYTAIRSQRFYANFDGTSAGAKAAHGHCITAPTSPFTITAILNNTTTVGTISIATNKTFTFATTGGTTFDMVAGDYLIFRAQSTIDSTLADLTWTVPGYDL